AEADFAGIGRGHGAELLKAGDRNDRKRAVLGGVLRRRHVAGTHGAGRCAAAAAAAGGLGQGGGQAADDDDFAAHIHALIGVGVAHDVAVAGEDDGGIAEAAAGERGSVAAARGLDHPAMAVGDVVAARGELGAAAEAAEPAATAAAGV